MYVLTKRADLIIKMAKEIARSYGVGYVGTEHLLLAISREGTSVGAHVLLEHGVTEESLRDEINKLIKNRLQETWVMGRLPGTPHFKDVIARASQEARGRGNWQICSIHLLLALASERGSVGCQALHNLGITPDLLRRSLTEQVA